MKDIRFEWDESKNLANQGKHGISFEEASRVFYDPLHISVQDRVVDGEQRWQALGFVEGIFLLLVAHTFREEQNDKSESLEVIRIISARRATRRERRHYEEENG